MFTQAKATEPDDHLEQELITLEQFFDWYPDNGGRFELHNGVIKEMQPTGTHERVAGFLASKLSVYIDCLNLPFFIPRQGLIKAIDSDKSAYIPDVMLLDQKEIIDEPLWQKRSTITRGKSIRLAIEVVSTNWQDDYLMKLAEYEKLGISEYWIVDYLGLGGKRYIGDPKQPTISVYHLVDGEYMVKLFRAEEVVRSPGLPELNLRAMTIFAT
jgi:Uma2 family endonuclease